MTERRLRRLMRSRNPAQAPLQAEALVTVNVAALAQREGGTARNAVTLVGESRRL
jgi:hypothetical protein